jgi:hypothetical protein
MYHRLLYRNFQTINESVKRVKPLGNLPVQNLAQGLIVDAYIGARSSHTPAIFFHGLQDSRHVDLSVHLLMGSYIF